MASIFLTQFSTPLPLPLLWPPPSRRNSSSSSNSSASSDAGPGRHDSRRSSPRPAMSSAAGPASSNAHSMRRRKRRLELSDGQEEIEKAVNADRAYRNYHTRAIKKSAEYLAAAPADQAAVLDRRSAQMWQQR